MIKYANRWVFKMLYNLNMQKNKSEKKKNELVRAANSL